jgi:hypothetical protein
MANFDRFLAVVGFFRSSGYFKLRKELNDVEEIKILVGINIDDIFRCHNKAMLMLENEEKAKLAYISDSVLGTTQTPRYELNVALFSLIYLSIFLPFRI